MARPPSLTPSPARSSADVSDGVVDDNDVTIGSATYALGVPQPHWALGDFDYNGFVDDNDVTLLGVFDDPAAPPLITPAPGGADVTAVPEPATLVLLGLGGLAIAVLTGVRRCRRRV